MFTESRKAHISYLSGGRTRWYHGGHGKVPTVFEAGIRWTAFDRVPVDKPVWLTPSLRFARASAVGSNGYVVEVMFKPRKVFPLGPLMHMDGRFYVPTAYGETLIDAMVRGDLKLLSSGEDEQDAEDYLKSLDRLDYGLMETSAVIGWLRRNRYDACNVRGDGPVNLAVLDPRNIRILRRVE